jgi:hypothetical protein
MICSNCNEDVAIVTVDGEYYCEDCQPYCEECGEPATHVEVNSSVYACEDHTNPGICGSCNGSGEGMYDGSTCHMCKGSGCEPTVRCDWEELDIYGVDAHGDVV